MPISLITLQKFRCFDFSTFNLENVTYICGENGTGKTSILEAISLINGQGSFRSKTLEELSKQALGNFEVSIETSIGRVFVGYGMEKKSLELDGDKATASQLKKMFCPVVFSPNHELALTTNSSTRNFIDKLIASLEGEHEKLLNKCRELSSERMKILYAGESKIWLDSVEEQIAQNFVVVCYNRLMFADKMQRFFNEIESKNKIETVDEWTQMLKNGTTFSNIEREIIQRLKNLRNEDKQAGRSKISINVAEYEIIFDTKRVQFCSSGQQKLMGGILTLATSFFAKKQNAEVITLLDDINAKIDEKNQGYFESIIEFVGTQTVISTIEKPQKNYFFINL